jgi:hypothetical protein
MGMNRKEVALAWYRYYFGICVEGLRKATTHSFRIAVSQPSTSQIKAENFMPQPLEV